MKDMNKKGYSTMSVLKSYMKNDWSERKISLKCSLKNFLCMRGPFRMSIACKRIPHNGCFCQELCSFKLRKAYTYDQHNSHRNRSSRTENG